MKKYLPKSAFIALLLLPMALCAQVQEGTLLGNWQDESLPSMFYGRYNEVWGITVNGVEYGVIGSTMGTHFISLEPNNGQLEEVAFVAGGAQGSNIIHRDFHSYQNYLYAVADEGSTSTLQVIDFSDLPNSVSVVYDANEFIITAHNIFIDEANARLYSTNGKVLSLADPTTPTLLGNGPIQGHDLFVKDHIVYANKGNSGLYIYDYTDASNPVLIGSLTDYENQGYNHSGWLSEDGSHYFLCDETGGALVKSLDVTDYADIQLVDMFKADNDNGNHIAHNAMVRGNLLYVSYYSDGLQVFDVTDPTRVVRKAFYDTYPGVNNSGFKGAWGVYALLPSGRVLVSDMATGLYLIEMPVDETLFVLDENIRGCANETISFDVLVGADFDNNGITMSVINTPSGVATTFNPNPVMPNDIVTVTLDPVGFETNLPLMIIAQDNDAVAQAEAEVEVVAVPEALTLISPNNGAEITELSPEFTWENSTAEVTLEISTLADLSVADVASLTLSGDSYVLPDNLDVFETYYWRVIRHGECGDSSSGIFSFSTITFLSADEVAAEVISVYPNPTKQQFSLQGVNLPGPGSRLDLLDVQGKLIQSWERKGTDSETFDVRQNLQGLYFLRISNKEYTATGKIVFE